MNDCRGTAAVKVLRDKAINIAKNAVEMKSRKIKN